MASFSSSFLQEMQWRGLIYQGTDLEELDALAAKGPITAYVGYDCTADSLHVGNLISIMMLRRLQQAGHKPIVLLGGATTKIGDPSGTDEVRKILTADQIEKNKAGIKRAFEKFLTVGRDKTDALFVDNAEWLDSKNYIDFLSEVGRHFTINRMLTFDSVKTRLDREQPLTFLEFNYMIFQAYDFMELKKRYNCVLQMGGSDQWGNIVNGVELARRMASETVFGLTTALLTTASGAKMGKSADGAVWLNDDRLPPYDYWQYWRNTDDADVVRFLKIFTDLPKDEIDKLAALKGQDINEAKKVLATEATALCHGREAAEKAAQTATDTFAGAGISKDLPQVDLTPNTTIIDACAKAFNESKGSVRKLIQNNGIKLNDQPVSDGLKELTANDLKDGTLKLSKGKKNHVLVKFQ